MDIKDKYDLIVKQITEIESQLKKEIANKETLSIKVSKLEDEYNDKNLRKLKLNFEDLKEDGEQAIIQFLTEIETSPSGIKSLTQFNGMVTQAGIKLKSKQVHLIASGDLRLSANRPGSDLVVFVLQNVGTRLLDQAGHCGAHGA